MATLKRTARALWRLIKTWPVRAQAVIVTTIACGTAFGLGWNGVQVGAVTALTAALLAFFTEKSVTSLEDPTVPAGTEITVKTPSGESDRTVTV